MQSLLNSISIAALNESSCNDNNGLPKSAKTHIRKLQHSASIGIIYCSDIINSAFDSSQEEIEYYQCDIDGG